MIYQIKLQNYSVSSYTLYVRLISVRHVPLSLSRQTERGVVVVKVDVSRASIVRAVLSPDENNN